MFADENWAERFDWMFTVSVLESSGKLLFEVVNRIFMLRMWNEDRNIDLAGNIYQNCRRQESG